MSEHGCALSILPSSEHERSQLVERVGKLQAEQNHGRDHQIGAQMHGGSKPQCLLEMAEIAALQAASASLTDARYRHFEKKTSAAAEVMPLSRASS